MWTNQIIKTVRIKTNIRVTTGALRRLFITAVSRPTPVQGVPNLPVAGHGQRELIHPDSKAYRSRLCGTKVKNARSSCISKPSRTLLTTFMWKRKQAFFSTCHKISQVVIKSKAKHIIREGAVIQVASFLQVPQTAIPYSYGCAPPRYLT